MSGQRTRVLTPDDSTTGDEFMSARPQEWRLRLTVRLVREGAVIAYPTEGVWGLGCIPEDEQAVARILDLKRRSWEQGLILAASDIRQLAPYLDGLAESQLQTLEETWPGPVTWLVPDNGYAPVWITGRHDSVALRVSNHPVIHGLCDMLGEPIVSTSANPAGKRPATTMMRLRQYFPQGIDYIFPGELGGAPGASEIRDLVTGKVLRPG